MTALAAFAQDDDKGFLTRTIQDALSGAGRTVSIEGFSGALSSQASFQRMTIADDDGIWLTLENVQLDWNRTALLRGRLEVEQLTAAELDLPRLPVAPEGVEVPEPEAGSFALPELPVSIQIADFAIARINLGAPLLGAEVQLGIKASATLNDEGGNVDLVAQRTDGKQGAFKIKASLERQDNVLDLLLDLTEEKEGIAARLLNLPGQPAVTMQVAGKGPLDNLVTEVTVATDGVERLDGQITIGAQAPRRPSDTPDRRIQANIGGDITALLAPRYRDFFGEDVRLKIDTLIEGTGAIEVSDFAITARAADLKGKVTLNQDSWPTFVDISGTITNPDGTSTLLPLGGEGTTVQRVDLRVAYDAANDEAFEAAFDIAQLAVPGVRVANTQLKFDGTLQGNLGSVGQFVGDMDFAANGLELVNAANAEAIGDSITGRANINYIEGQPIRISELDLTGTDYGLAGMIVVNGLESGLLTRLNVTLKADDLSRFSALAGREIDGQADLQLKGTATPLSGAFDLETSGSTTDLRLGIAQADAVLAGRTALTLTALRNENGTFLRDMVLDNEQINLTGQAELRTDASAVEARFRLNDVALVVPQYSGPVTVTAKAQQDTRGWVVDAATDGPFGAQLTAKGLATGPNAALTFTADVPDAKPFAEQVEGPVKASGTLRQSPEGWLLDTSATGPYAVKAAVKGLISPALDVRFDASVPEVNPLVPQLNGAAAAKGRLHQTDAGLLIDVTASGPYAATAQVNGQISPALDVRFDASVPEVNPLVPQLNGAAAAKGRLHRTDTGLLIDVTASGPNAATAQVNGKISPALDVRFDASVPDLNPLVPQLNGPAAAKGRLHQTDAGLLIDAAASGPYAAKAQVNGQITPALDINFDASIPDLNPLVPQLNGAGAAQGRLRQTDAGFLIDVTADGPYAAKAQVNGQITPAIDVRFDASVPNLRPLVPQFNGAGSAQGRLRQTGKGFVVDMTASGPYGARAAVEGLATGPEMQLTFDAGVANVQPLVPGISGPLAAKGVVRQTPAGISINTNATGPYASRAFVSGVVTGPQAAVEYTLAMPNIGVLVERVTGPLDLRGTARKEGSAWRINTSADGPSGTQANVAGRVNSDGTLNLDINGSAPLGLSRPFIAPRNLQGQAQFDLSLNGPATLSSLSGTIRTSNAALSEPNLRLALTDIAGAVQLGNSRANIDITGNVSNGGRLRVGGGVTLTGSLPADISVALENVVLIDPRLYQTSLSGAVRVAGPLTGGAVISGQVNLGETNVNVPSTGLTSIGDIPQITHVGARAGVATTRSKAGLTGAAAGSDPAAVSNGPGFALDLSVSAPNRIFVRGRGLDAELGGRLALSGSTNRIISAGRFELIRGRLDILGKRFDLEEGTVQFQGDLVPYLRFVSATDTASGEVRVIVEGPADEPTVSFEATPDAPQDEVLAQLLFGRNIADISAFQALQLASAVATLAGRGGGGIISNLRDGFGLDDLDVTTTEDGATALRLGKYLTDNVYTDVTATSTGEADVSLNIDITPNLTGKATLGSTGESSIGLFFEKDY